jgi:phage baseplate assembly protein W
VSGDIPKTTSFKEISTSLENLTTTNLGLHIIHREYMEQLDSRIFTPLKPEQNFILSRCLDASISTTNTLLIS